MSCYNQWQDDKKWFNGDKCTGLTTKMTASQYVHVMCENLKVFL